MMTHRLLPLFLLLALPVFAADVAFTLMPPTAPVAAGGAVRVDLAAMNPGGLEAPFGAPLSISGKILGEGAAHEVTLDSVSGAPVSVSPGGFAVRHYRLTLPSGVTGRVVLEVNSSSFGVLRTVLDVEPVAVVKADETPKPATSSAKESETQFDKLTVASPVASGIARTFAGRFMPNQPIYFLYGHEPRAVKFQLQFRLQARLHEMGQAEAPDRRCGSATRSVRSGTLRFVQPVLRHELHTRGGFRLRTRRCVKIDHRGPLAMGWRAGYQHESNGKDGADSRSLNTFYLRPRSGPGRP